MVPRDLPTILFHILELKNPNSASNFGLQSDPRSFFLIFYHLTLNLTLKVNFQGKMDLRFEFSTVDLTYRRSKGEIGDRRLNRIRIRR